MMINVNIFRLINIDASDGLEVLGVMDSHKDAVYSLATTTDHSKLISTSAGVSKNLLVWDAQSLKCEKVMIAGSDPIFHACISSIPVVFNPEGADRKDTKRTLILSGARDGTVRIHDIDNEHAVASFVLEGSPVITHTAFCPQLTPSGSLLAAVCARDGTMHLLEIKPEGISSGRVLGTHDGAIVSGVRFLPATSLGGSPNGAPIVLTCGADGFIRLFDLRTLYQSIEKQASPKALVVYEGHFNGQVRGTRMNKQGDMFVSFSHDGCLRVWAVNPIKDAEIRVSHLKSDLESRIKEREVYHERISSRTEDFNKVIARDYDNAIDTAKNNLTEGEATVEFTKQRLAAIQLGKDDVALRIEPLWGLLGHSQVASSAVWAPIGGANGTIVSSSWDCTVKTFDVPVPM